MFARCYVELPLRSGLLSSSTTWPFPDVDDQGPAAGLESSGA
jgi:hypothetical protein